jgi:hypothetical protein
MLGAYFSAMAFLGLALAVGALTVGVIALSYPSELLVLLILIGLLVASAGMVLLGGLTLAERVLPGGAEWRSWVEVLSACFSCWCPR